MPGIFRRMTFEVDLYLIDLANEWRISNINTLKGIDASLDSPGPADSIEAITLYNVAIGEGLAVVQYSEESKKMKIMYLKGQSGIIETPAEIGRYYPGIKRDALEKTLVPLLEKRENPRLFRVSSAAYYDGSKLVKLMFLDSFLRLFDV